MPAQPLWAPWRLEYVAQTERPPGCIFCLGDGAAEDRERLVVHRGERAFAILNRYPYNNGHVLVVPRAHVGEPGDLAPDDWAALNDLLLATVDVLREAMSPDGVNVGMNLGRCAGAGVPDHLHWHVLPRWDGDTSWLPLLADTKMVPQHLVATWDDLTPRFARRLGGPEGGEP